MSANALRIGDEAPDFYVQDASGERVHLRSLCQSGPVILLFLRSPG